MKQFLFWAIFIAVLINSLIYLGVCYYAGSWDITLLEKAEKLIVSVIFIMTNMCYIAGAIGTCMAKYSK